MEYERMCGPIAPSNGQNKPADEQKSAAIGQPTPRHADGMDVDKCEPNPPDHSELLEEFLKMQKPKKKPFYDSAIDRCKGIEAAGFDPPADGMTVAKLLKPGIGQMPKNQVSRKFWQINNLVPCLGHSVNTRRTPGTYYDFDYWRRAYCLKHGVPSKNEPIKDLINPPLKTNFANSLEETDEKLAQYLKHSLNVTGRSHTYKIPPLPDHLDRLKTTFGDASVHDPLPPIVNPRKTREQVEKDAIVGHSLYRQTHEAFWPGEQINRKYFPAFDASKTMGMKTNVDSRGLGAKRGAEDADLVGRKKQTPVVTLTQADLEDQWKRKLGRPLEPNRILKQVGTEFVFGQPPVPHPDTVKMLMHDQLMYPASEDRDFDRFRQTVSVVRKQLRDQRFFRFEELLIAFENEDKKYEGKVHADDIRKILHRFNILHEMDPKLLNDLLEYCERGDTCPCSPQDYNRCIDHVLFHACLNYLYEDGIFMYEKLPINERPQQMKGSQSQPANWTKTAYVRSNDVTHLQTTPAGDWNTDGMRYYGTPSVRYDVKVPAVRRIHDVTNYGDQPSVQRTINPSSFGRHAIPDIDLYRARPPAELKTLFLCSGFNLTDDQFNQLYQQAQNCDPSGCGQVSVESFRSALACHCCIREGPNGTQHYECCFDAPETAVLCPGKPKTRRLPNICKEKDAVELRNKRAATDLALSAKKAAAAKDDVSEFCRQKGFKKNEGLEEACPFKTKRLPNISPYVIHGVM